MRRVGGQKQRCLCRWTGLSSRTRRCLFLQPATCHGRWMQRFFDASKSASMSHFQMLQHAKLSSRCVLLLWEGGWFAFQHTHQAFLQSLLPQDVGPGLPHDQLAGMTENFSGSDLHIVCKEAAMRPLRRLRLFFAPLSFKVQTH